MNSSFKLKLGRMIFDAVSNQPNRKGWHIVSMIEELYWGRCDPRWNGAHFELCWDALTPNGTHPVTERAEIYGTLTQCVKGIEIGKGPAGSWAVYPLHL